VADKKKDKTTERYIFVVLKLSRKRLTLETQNNETGKR
jgi:hypothetical protein